MSGSKWWDESWPVLTGCSPMSSGCANCWAKRQAHRGMCARHRGLTTPDGEWAGQVRFNADAWSAPLHWREPRVVFVAPMSDVFHPRVTDQHVGDVFSLMSRCPQHTFVLLTKRPERAYRWLVTPGITHAAIVGGLPLSSLWLGVSVEDQATADERIPILLQTPAAHRVMSFEPALGPVDLSRYLPGNCSSCGKPYDRFSTCGRCEWITDSPGVDAVLVGGETGPSARPCDVEWVRSVVRQCRKASVPCFVKALGARAIESTPGASHVAMWCKPESDCRECNGLRLQDSGGADPSEWPADLRVRELAWRLRT